jgi:hypothetical protein
LREPFLDVVNGGWELRDCRCGMGGPEQGKLQGGAHRAPPVNAAFKE